MDIEQLITPPKIIAFATTYQCTASCKNCCFGCKPTNKKRLSLSEMKNYVDQAMQYYGDSMEVLVLTGGQPFLLNNDLVKIVKYGSDNNLTVRVVTNGYWAKTEQEANDILLKLRNNGLKEINFSTGDDHLEWVPYDNIVFGCMAAMNLGIACLVNVESHDKSKFSSDTLLNDHRLSDYFDFTKYKAPLRIENGIWIPFDIDTNLSCTSLTPKKDLTRMRCHSLFTTLPISPYSQLMACCGLVCERIKPFRLGNLKINSIKELYEEQFLDFIKIWIYTEGPYSNHSVYPVLTRIISYFFKPELSKTLKTFRVDSYFL